MSCTLTFDALSALDWTPPSPSALSAALRQLDAPSNGPIASTSQLRLDSDPAPSLLDSAFTASDLPQASSSGTSGAEWLRHSLGSPLAEQALEILRGPAADAEAASSLWELWGDERIDQVGEAISRRASIVRSASQAHTSLQPTASAFEPNGRAAELRRGYTPGAQMQFATQEEIAAAKRARKAHRAKGRGRADEHDEVDLDEWDRIRGIQLAQGPGALVSGKRVAVTEVERYPNVYLSNANASTVPLGGQKMTLPVGTTRTEHEYFEEIMIPAPAAVPFRFNEELLPINKMDMWGRRTFHAYKSLNRLQSIVFPVAYSTNENMLVCAPTGAGKTDVALLSILRCLSQLTSTPLNSMTAAPTLPPPSQYKIIYVAPLKALAAEITLKFARRLSWAGVKVRELTGDMKLTKKEMDETGILVTTPEKWDVVTRKGAGAGDTDVAEVVKLLIIDEVHLLHEDRGAVIESLVARTLRQVESTQLLIRIVGLSATLPNYVDVADFLRVNRYTGLFFFDASFRPVPLEQHFVGVKGKAGSQLSRANLDNACFEKVAELLRAGHQVMVFVHARKDTVKTAQTLHEKAAAEGLGDLLNPNENEHWPSFQKDLRASRNREMKELAGLGFGIHHAGMLRSDRNIAERLFEQNVTKILCCTATLAWGVNLPAYAVVIKGTQIYDSSKGSFVDLGILDVLQIFGRAGRPQYESQGVGYICTNADKLDHYVSAITQQHPIESKFVEGLIDSLNAEIALGTVSTVDEGVRWLGYTYLYQRMRKNPLVYGMLAAEVMQDPHLGGKRQVLMNTSAKRLVELQMVQWDQDLGTLIPTDTGRIASRYYIKHASVEIYNAKLRASMSEADVLELIAASVEFDQVSIRENEIPELTKLVETVCPCQVKGATQSSTGKVNVLLQAFISRAYIDDFALVSDSGYVAQNAGRIVRALLEIAMAKRWAPVSLVLMSMSKAIEKRMWPYAHPLGQFDLSGDLMYNIERWADDVPIEEVVAMSDADFGALIHQNERLGAIAIKAAKQLPALEVTHTLQPVTHDLLRIRLELKRSFEWNDRQHGSAEAFWVWIEDAENLSMLALARVLVRPSTTTLHHEFVVPIAENVPSALHARLVSDRWLGSEQMHSLALDKLVMPPPPPPHLPLLDLPLLEARTAFGDAPNLQAIYSKELSFFDPVQTQTVHAMWRSSANALICAPSAPSRGTLLELAIWRAFEKNPNARVVFLTPRKALARQVALRIRRTFSQRLTTPTLLLGRRTQDLDEISKTGPLIVVGGPTPLLKKLVSEPKLFGELDLIVAHDLHALDGPYELVLSRLLWAHPRTRVVGSSSSLLDPSSIAEWLGVPEHATFNFSPSARSSALTTTFQSFTTAHSAALLRSMIKPAYSAMRTAAGSSLLFVPSRTQCKATALDLVTQTATDFENSFVEPDAIEAVSALAQTISDPDLAEALTHGIAVYHEGLRTEEQRLALELFASGTVRVLITARESAWMLPVRASLVIVLSAQYAVIRGVERQREIREYPLPDLLQMQALAVGQDQGSSAELLVLCQREQAELYGRYLAQGVPVESELVGDSTWATALLQDVQKGRVNQRQDVVEQLSWTHLARRAAVNPSYYALTAGTSADDHLSRLADEVLSTLEQKCCLLMNGKTEFTLTEVGKVVLETGASVSELEKLQLLGLDALAELVRPKGAQIKADRKKVAPLEGAAERGPEHAPTPAEATSVPSPAEKTLKAREKEREGHEVDGVAPSSHATFLSKLPRAIRDSVGPVESWHTEELNRRVMLAAFVGGRVPRGADSKLEREMGGLIRRALSRAPSALA